MSVPPPPLLRRILESALPREVRDGIVGDLDEVYRAARLARDRGWDVLLVDGPGGRKIPVDGRVVHDGLTVDWTVVETRGEYAVVRGAPVRAAEAAPAER